MKSKEEMKEYRVFWINSLKHWTESYEHWETQEEEEETMIRVSLNGVELAADMLRMSHQELQPLEEK